MKFVIYVVLPTILFGMLADNYGVAWAVFCFSALIYWLKHNDHPNIGNGNQPLSANHNDDLAKRVNVLEQQIAALQARLIQLESANGRALSPAGDLKQTETVSTVSDTPMEAETVMASTAFSHDETRSEAGADAVSIPVTEIPQAPETVIAAVTTPDPSPEIHQNTQSSIHNTDYRRPNPLPAWLLAGNPLLKTGMVVLFLGLAFLLRYVGGHIPIELKYLGVFASGMAATVGGWRLQSRQREYGLALQGFGFSIMYLTALSALKWHELLPAGLVFAVMVGLVGWMTYGALKQDAKILAQVAVIGGLAAPILTANGNGHHIVLLTYLSLLNIGVATIAWFKTWRSLNIIGFTGTFGITLAWGADAYTPHHFGTAEPFLIYHWLLYTLIACFFARNTLRHEPLSGKLARIPDNASLSRIWQTFTAYGSHISALDSTLLFGTAITAFGLQYHMVENTEQAAWFALLFAAVYAGFAYYFARQEPIFAVIKQAFMALALLFVTLALPLALDGQWTAAAWTLEAALVYTFGLAERQPQMRVGALAVYGMAVFREFGNLNIGTRSILTGSLFGTLLATVTGAGIYYAWHLYRRERSAQWEINAQNTVLVLALCHAVTIPMLLWSELGTAMTMAGYGLVLVLLQLKHQNRILGTFVFICNIIAVACFDFNHSELYGPWLISGVVWLLCAYWLHQSHQQSEHNGIGKPNRYRLFIGWWLLIWSLFQLLDTVSVLLVHHGIKQPYWQFIPVLLPTVYAAKRLHWRAAAQAAGIATGIWIIGLGVHAHDWIQTAWLAGSMQLLCATGLLVYLLRSLHHNVWHAMAATTLLGAWTFWFGNIGSVYFPHTAWAQWMWLAVPLLAWRGIFILRDRPLIRHHLTVYWYAVSPILTIYALCWVLQTNWIAPQPSGLPYLPVLNPLELGSIMVIWQSARFLHTWSSERSSSFDTVAFGKIIPFAFAWLLITTAVMRLWHIYGHVDWQLTGLLASFGLQASLSIVWAFTAIILMVLGNQRLQRNLWMIGAGLMGVVVGKLFFVELGNSGGVARIVSFIVVGLLLLLVGWFAPAPPKTDRDPS